MPSIGGIARAIALLFVFTVIVVTQAQPGTSQAAEGEPPDLEIVKVTSNNNDNVRPGRTPNPYTEMTFAVSNVGKWWVGETIATVETTLPHDFRPEVGINSPRVEGDTIRLPDLDPRGQEGVNPSVFKLYLLVRCPVGSEPSTARITISPATDYAGDVETNLANNTVTADVCSDAGNLRLSPTPKPAPGSPIQGVQTFTPSNIRSLQVYRMRDAPGGGWSAPKTVGALTTSARVAGWGQDKKGGSVIFSKGGWISQTAVLFDSAHQRTAGNPLYQDGKSVTITKATITFEEEPSSPLYWTNANGAAQDKPEGCVEVRVPAGNWVSSPPPLLIPFITYTTTPATKKISKGEWDVTLAFRRQREAANQGYTPASTTTPPNGFGYLLTGKPNLTSLNADDDERCTSVLSNITLNVNYTVAE